MELRSISLQKKSQYLTFLTKQAWSINDLLYGKRTIFSWGTQRIIPSGDAQLGS